MAKRRQVQVWVDIDFDDKLNEVKNLIRKNRRRRVSNADITKAISKRIKIKDLLEDELIRI